MKMLSGNGRKEIVKEEWKELVIIEREWVGVKEIKIHERDLGVEGIGKEWKVLGRNERYWEGMKGIGKKNKRGRERWRERGWEKKSEREILLTIL